MTLAIPRIEDHQALIAWVAGTIKRNAYREGIALDLDDAKQEAAMVFLLCTRHFNPDKGAKFSTYFIRAAMHEYRNIVTRLAGREPQRMISLHQPLPCEDGSDPLELISTLEDPESENPETRFARDEEVARRLRDRTLRKVAELCAHPDAEMAQELAALKAQEQWARERGINVAQAPTGLTPRMVGKALGFNWRNRQDLIEAMEEPL